MNTGKSANGRRTIGEESKAVREGNRVSAAGMRRRAKLSGSRRIHAQKRSTVAQ